MKILLVNQAFVSFDEPGFTRHFEMAKFLRERGHEMVIVASDVNYQTGGRIVEHRGFVAEQEIEGVRVLRAFMLPSLHRNYFWRIVSFVGFMFSAVIGFVQGAGCGPGDGHLAADLPGFCGVDGGIPAAQAVPVRGARPVASIRDRYEGHQDTRW